MTRRAAVLRWIVIFVALFSVAGAAGVGGMQWLRPRVTVTRTAEGPVVQAFYATGTLLPEHEYPIKANNAGFLTDVLVDKGSKVDKGQALATVHEDAVQYKFDQAKADRDLKAKLADEKTSPILKEFDSRISAASDLLEIAQREHRRLLQAVEKGASSPTDVDRALDRVKTNWSALESLKAQRAARKLELEKDLEVAEAALKIAQWNVDRQTIRSPISGVVLDRPLTVGTRVAVNDRIMQIADVRPDQLIMRAAVDEEDKTQVFEGQAVRMTLYSFADRTFAGTVKKVYEKADPERRTFEVDVTMTEKEPLFAAGMTGELAFIIASKPSATVIPSQAIQNGQVWIVRDGRIVPSEAKIGLRSVERVEVLSGLSEHDQVVISPIEGLQDRTVRTIYMDPIAAAGLNKPKETKVFRGFN